MHQGIFSLSWRTRRSTELKVANGEEIQSRFRRRGSPTPNSQVSTSAFTLKTLRLLIDRGSAWILSALAWTSSHDASRVSFFDQSKILEITALSALSAHTPQCSRPLSIFESNGLFAFKSLRSRDKIFLLNRSYPLGVLKFFSMLHLPG